MNRRHFISYGFTIGGLGLCRQVAALTPTPSASQGPYYPDLELPEVDADLTTIAGRSWRALGDITDLSGRILDLNGNPIAQARVEIWQCDVNGRYRHSSEETHRDMDRGFQGFGASITRADGSYRFRTIKPVPYPGRTPHIHMRVVVPGHPVLVTQLYILGEPRNAKDFLFNRMTEAQQALASSDFVKNSATGLFEAKFDVVVGYSI